MPHSSAKRRESHSEGAEGTIQIHLPAQLYDTAVLIAVNKPMFGRVSNGYRRPLTYGIRFAHCAYNAGNVQSEKLDVLGANEVSGLRGLKRAPLSWLVPE